MATFQLLLYLIQTISYLPFNFLNKKLKLKASLVQGRAAAGRSEASGLYF